MVLLSNLCFESLKADADDKMLGILRHLKSQKHCKMGDFIQVKLTILNTIQEMSDTETLMRSVCVSLLIALE